LNIRPGHEQRLGAGTADRENLNWQIRAAESALQVEKQLVALHPEKRVPGAPRTGLIGPDGKNVEMSCRYPKHVVAMVEKLRMAPIEGHAARRSDRGSLVGRRLGLLKEGLDHSCDTSLA
jgi:hypothetical protein